MYRFRRVVTEALASLPPHIHERLDNVAITVADEPAEEQIEGDEHSLYGHYEGVPLTDRTSGYGFTLPDRIVIYRGPLERDYPEPRELREQIRITVLHEIGHHLGFSEDNLERMGIG